MRRTQGILFVAQPLDPVGEDAPRVLVVTLPDLADSLRYAEVRNGVEDAFVDAMPTGWRFASHGLLDPRDLEHELAALGSPGVPPGRVCDIEDFCDPQTGAVNEAAVARLGRRLREDAPHLRPRLTVGTIARGANFHDRENALEEIAASLVEGHVLLTAPRRFGKSSLLYALTDQPPAPWLPALADVEDATSPAELVAKVVVALRRTAWLTDFPEVLAAAGPCLKDAGFREVEAAERELAREHEGTWANYLNEVFAALSAGQVPALLLMDEFAWVIEHLREAGDEEQTAALVRALTQVAAPEASYRLLIAGSANLGSLLHGLPEPVVEAFFGAFHRFPLPPMAPAAGRELVRTVLAANGLYPSSEVLDAILGCIGTPIPYFLQLFASRIVEHAAGDELAAADVQRLYEGDLLGPDSKRFFEHYTRAANCYPADWQAPARDILTHLTGGPAAAESLTAVIRRMLPAATDAAAEQLLALLEEDLYIGKNAAGNFEFTSKVLRDWWQRHGRLGASA